MTEIDFHFNVPDRLAYACRLLRKAARRNAQVVVTAPSAVLDQLDRQLWTFSALDFIAHVRCKADHPVLERLRATPVWLADDLRQAPHHAVLLNLFMDVEPVAGFESFKRLIELVSIQADDRQAARARWKHYADRGYVISRHDVAQDSVA